MPETEGVYYSDSGHIVDSEPPVVLIHGAGSSSLSWNSFRRTIGAGRRILSLDLPGHGRSSDLPFNGIADQSRAVIDVINAAHIYRAILMGHSMGGAVALQTALVEPERICGLVLIASGATLPVPLEIVEQLGVTATRRDAQAWLVDNTLYPLKDTGMRRLLEQEMVNARPGILRNDLIACRNFDVTERLAEIRVPALVIAGEMDRMTPPGYCRALAEGLPDSTLKVIYGAGHLLPVAWTQETASVVLDFLPSVCA